jgi:carbon monoxide dehydrogenase subunit G
MPWQSTRSIDAPADAVFRVVADPVAFQRAVGADPDVQFLTPQKAGIGARFRASRVNRGKTMSFEQEVIAYEPDRLVRMINTTHGVLWDSTFEVQPRGSAASLTVTMRAETGNPLKKIMMRLIARMVQRALDQDMDAVKRHVEKRASLHASRL